MTKYRSMELYDLQTDPEMNNLFDKPGYESIIESETGIGRTSNFIRRFDGVPITG